MSNRDQEELQTQDQQGRDNTPPEGAGPGAATLAYAYVWSELRGQGWKLFAFPLVFGTVLAIGTGFAALTTVTFDPQTTAILRELSTQYFINALDESDLLLAFVVVQGPSVVALLAALTSLIMVQTGLGKRLAIGEFELLLSAPYRERDVFAALVLGSFCLSLIGIAILAVLSMGIGLTLLHTSGAQLSTNAITFVLVGLVAPVPMALWATFVAVVVYLIYPDAATNNSHPANLLATIAILPALGLMLTLMSGASVDPLLLAIAANVVPLTAIGIGWVTVRRWFSVEKIL